jgi:uncharacterized protein YndB with AHSA1/START domain
MRPATDTLAQDRVLELVRVFQAPRALVWRAWTDPAMLARWKGPRGFTAIETASALRPGGAWRVAMQRDGTDEVLRQSGVYRAIEAPARLMFTYAWDRDDGTRSPETLIDIAFAEEGAATRMVFRQSLFETDAARDDHAGGWTSAFEKLAEALATVA